MRGTVNRGAARRCPVAQPAGYSRQGRLRGLLRTVSLHPAQPARAGPDASAAMPGPDLHPLLFAAAKRCESWYTGTNLPPSRPPPLPTHLQGRPQPMIILYNPRAAETKRRLPLSVLSLAAVFEG